ncbi:sugar O-acetyltransferase [Corynebacterium sp. 3HC-13]|uniref:sugar O-acetyltransferase n=1 Tax=Corynebacterium poyangense TaxID=2684405 RepID=UPI001CCC3B1A|nr:sugar O-acetyltransferase [Corynebacterium poyangense]MBZ8177421.1 sugar O-acetyltransferase [Corynebacterium poyangense]
MNIPSHHSASSSGHQSTGPCRPDHNSSETPAWTGFDRMAAGQWHLTEAPETLGRQRLKTAAALKKFNDLANTDPRQAADILRSILAPGSQPMGVHAPCQIEYGFHTFLDEGVFLNYNTVILDSAPVRIGAYSMLAPNCQLLTINHPVHDVAMRRAGWEQAKPITIGKDVWLGGGVTVLGGVTIGDGAVIAAGAVVNRDIPPRTLAAGVPARVIRELQPDHWERQELPEAARHTITDDPHS